jgi:alpha-L-rhamnosidase
MKKISFPFSILLIVVISFQSFSQVTVKNLKCEYLENPIGIDEPHPRFTWQMELEKPGSHQTAYELVVGTTETGVALGRGDMWESGEVNSSVIPVLYKGKELEPFTRYFWSVRVKDEEQQWSAWSEPLFFETGMICQHNWKGKWITDTYDFNVSFFKIFDLENHVQVISSNPYTLYLYRILDKGAQVITLPDNPGEDIVDTVDLDGVAT